MIIQKEVEVTWVGIYIKHYLKFGYRKKLYDKFLIKVEHLPQSSKTKIKCLCEKCKKEFFYEFFKINKYGSELCPQCRMTKIFKSHYGKIENPEANKKLSERKNRTHFKKTGYKSVSADPNIQKIRSDTYEKKTGYRNPFSNPEIIEKIVNKNLINFKKKGKIPSSKYQKHLCKLLGGTLNYIFGRTAIDIAFIKEKIAIEYNGGGHYYSVLIGAETLNKAKQKDRERGYYLNDRGWKIIYIDHFSKKTIYDDKTMLQLIKFAKQYLLYTKRKWVRIDADNNKIYSKNFKFMLSDNGNIIF